MPYEATWMQLQIMNLTEISQKEKDKYRMKSVFCGIENTTQLNLSMEQKH